MTPAQAIKLYDGGGVDEALSYLRTASEKDKTEFARLLKLRKDEAMRRMNDRAYDVRNDDEECDACKI